MLCGSGSDIPSSTLIGSCPWLPGPQPGGGLGESTGQPVSAASVAERSSVSGERELRLWAEARGSAGQLSSVHNCLQLAPDPYLREQVSSKRQGKGLQRP